MHSSFLSFTARWGTLSPNPVIPHAVLNYRRLFIYFSSDVHYSELRSYLRISKFSYALRTKEFKRIGKFPQNLDEFKNLERVDSYENVKRIGHSTKIMHQHTKEQAKNGWVQRVTLVTMVTMLVVRLSLATLRADSVKLSVDAALEQTERAPNRRIVSFTSQTFISTFCVCVCVCVYLSVTF